MNPVRARMDGEQRTPLFFGNPAQQLYGCFHAPASGPRSNCVVVLCQPFGQEYIRAHRSFVQLAVRLAGRGFPVLRFDYSCTGDSAGDAGGASTEQWLADLHLAITEAKNLAGVPAVCLLGLRLGALLALTYCARNSAVDSLVLWDAVTDGPAWLEEVRTLHEQELRYAYVQRDTPAAGSMDEVLGFPMPPALREQISGLHAYQLQRPPARDVLLIDAGASAGGRALHALLAPMPLAVEHRQLPERSAWRKEPLRGTVPTRLLDEIVNWIVRVHA